MVPIITTIMVIVIMIIIIMFCRFDNRHATPAFLFSSFRGLFINITIFSLVPLLTCNTSIDLPHPTERTSRLYEHSQRQQRILVSSNNSL